MVGDKVNNYKFLSQRQKQLIGMKKFKGQYG